MDYLFFRVSPDGVTYSVDKLLLDFKLKVYSGESFASDFLLFLSWEQDLYFEHWESRQIGTFRQQFSFKCSKNNSFWVGVGLNSTGQVVNRVRLEFNPNKVGNDMVFIKVFNRLCVLSSRPPRIVRFDLALDIPVLRENAFLLKDARLYEEYQRSRNNRTQYLGERNKHGRCKLYNKQLESGLSYPLTRFEITLDSECMTSLDVLAVWPKIVILDDLQLTFSDWSLSDVDRFILLTLIDFPERINELNRRKKEKIGCILEQYTRILSLDIQIYKEIVQQLSMFSQVIPVSFSFDPFSGYSVPVTSL